LPLSLVAFNPAVSSTTVNLSEALHPFVLGAQLAAVVERRQLLLRAVIEGEALER
jgi:hypothetical protein